MVARAGHDSPPDGYFLPLGMTGCATGASHPLSIHPATPSFFARSAEIETSPPSLTSVPSGKTSVPGYVLVCFVMPTGPFHTAQPPECGC